MFAIVQHQSCKVLFHCIPWRVNDYPWEIVGMDFVIGLSKSSEFHFTTIIDSCLPSEMVHVLSCHKKSPLTKPPLLITVIDFMVFHKPLCLNDDPVLLANWRSLMRKLNKKVIMSAA